MDILGQQAIGIAQRQRILEPFARLVLAAQDAEGVDQPEAADQEFGFRQAEIVLGGIAHDMVAPH